MVIYADQQWAAVEPRSDSCLPMTGEGSGLEALASLQAGYLGKVQERAASLEYCPWCTSKGLTYALRSYRINLQESITLCTNPQCLFPLVTRPLEDVLASIAPGEPTVGNKRKSAWALEEEELIKSPLKRQRPSEDGDVQPQSDSRVPVSSLEHFSLNSVINRDNGNTNTESENVNGTDKDSPDVETVELENKVVPNRDDPVSPACSGSVGHSEVWSTGNGARSPSLSSHSVSPDVLKQNNVPALNTCIIPVADQAIYSASIPTSSQLSSDQTSSTEKDGLVADLPLVRDVDGFHSESRDLSDEFVTVPKQLLWRNSDNLCWLDSLLAVLVNCKSLRKLRPEGEPQCSSVWWLLREYEDISAAVQAHQQTGRDGVPRVPSHVLQKAHVDLQSLRMSIFKLLQPKLHCRLGRRETPVFAMPILLTLDSWVECLFQTTYHWEFKCSKCKIITKERVVKTLSTFTNIVLDWTPLNAVHFAPCNVCCKKNQMRAMLLESVAPVFALHFVEGLPDNHIGNYAFNFKGRRYSVTTVIQYSHQLKHFVAWIHRGDGSWLEYDDLKYPLCQTHQQLQIPAQEIHVVFWEAEEDSQPPVCSSSNELPEPPPAGTEPVPSLKDVITEEPSTPPLDRSIFSSVNDTDIVCALSDCSSNVVDTTVNTSIGASTLLDTFEGLSHNDIITLSLVEMQPDSLQSEGQPLKEIQQTEGLSAPVRMENAASSPTSSIPAAGGDLFAPSSSPCDSESADNSASDPTFVPNRKRERGKIPNTRKTVDKQRGKKAASSKEASQSAPPKPSEPPEPVCSAQNKTSTTDQTSTVSSTNNSHPLSTQNDRWSFIVNRQFHKNISPPPTQNIPMISEGKPSHPIRSTPNPVKKIPSVVPRAPLLIEEGKSLPPKAAEMYGGFGAKNSIPVVPLPSPFPSPLPPAVPPSYQTPLTWTSGTSPSLLTEISSFKKTTSSKLPSVLNDTDTLRYKLLKKLKAKKKKLAKLNQMLGNGGGAHLRPDSTNRSSPSAVSSSTFDGSTCDDILSDLLSPATTASNLSPDSTGFLEMLAGGQDGSNQLEVNGAGVVPQTNYQTSQHEDHNFLEEFFSQL